MKRRVKAADKLPPPLPTLAEQEGFLVKRAATAAEMYGTRDTNALMWKALLESVQQLRALPSRPDAS